MEIIMKKINLKLIALACLLTGTSNIAFADYNGCRGAGGGFFECFVGAAMNDRIAAPSGETGSTKPAVNYTEQQIKDSFAKNSKACGKLAVEKQYACLSKGMALKPVKEVTKKVSKPMIEKVSKPAVAKPVLEKVSQ
jgi:hypothetical protein